MRRLPAGLLSSLTTSERRRDLFERRMDCRWQSIRSELSRRLSKRATKRPRVGVLAEPFCPAFWLRKKAGRLPGESGKSREAQGITKHRKPKRRCLSQRVSLSRGDFAATVRLSEIVIEATSGCGGHRGRHLAHPMHQYGHDLGCYRPA